MKIVQVKRPKAARARVHRMVNFWFRYATTVFVNYNVEFLLIIMLSISTRCANVLKRLGARRPIRVEFVRSTARVDT